MGKQGVRHANRALYGPLPRVGSLGSGLAMPTLRDQIGMAREIPDVVDSCAVHVYTHTEYEEELPSRERA